MKKFDPDFTRTRVRPKQPWERNPTTWEDILNEIGDAVFDEEPQLTIEERLEILEERSKKTAKLALANQYMFEGMQRNIDSIVLLMEKHFGQPDRL